MRTPPTRPAEMGLADTPDLTGEQELAVGERAAYTLVSASAGTGKTLSLVARVLAAVRSGIPLDRLLVVTFTQKAAREVRERLNEALRSDPVLRPQRLLLAQSHVATIDSFCARLLREQAVAAGIDPGFKVLADPFDQLVRDAIVDDVFHHWYLGRPKGPAGAPSEWTDVPVRRSREHREFLRLVDLCGDSEGREVLKREIERLMALARAHPSPAEFTARLEANLTADRPPYLYPFAEMLSRSWVEAIASYERMCALARAHFPVKATAQERFLETLKNAPAPWDAGSVEAIAAELSQRFPESIEALRSYLRATETGCDSSLGAAAPRLPNKSTPLLGPLNDHAKKLLGVSSQTKSLEPFAWLPEDPREVLDQYRATARTLGTLLALLNQVMAAYDAHKRERGLMDFADLELHARRFLRAAPDELRRRFAMVLVDEFQDINRLQADIINALEPEQGRFLVGDVKQCIYQFRLSDPTIFRDLFEGARVKRPGDATTFSPEDTSEKTRLFLSRNFRSRAPVLATVNSLLEPLLTRAMIGGDYSDEALKFGATSGLEDADDWIGRCPRVAPASDDVRLPAERRGWAPVEIHLIDKPGPKIGLPEDPVLSVEASLAARRIQALISDGLPVFDRAGKRWRPLSYADVAVILRSPRPTGAIYARILRAHGIPVVFGGREFFDRREVRDFICLLRTLDNAHDDVSLAAFLRMPGSEFDDADLARIRLIWPRSHYFISAVRATASGESDEWSGPCENRHLLTDSAGRALVARCHRLLSALDHWRMLAQNDDLATALARVLDESGLLTAATAADGGRDSLGNLQRLLARARDYCAEHGHSLSGFIEHLDAVRVSGGFDSFSAAEEATDAVRILSLHQAKGLEFPAVVLSSLGRRINISDTRHPILTGADWLGVDIFDPVEFRKTPTIARRALARMRLRAILDEEIRILYVALTRAREKLIVTSVLPKPWDSMLKGCALWTGDGPVLESLLYDARRPIDWVIGALHRARLSDGLAQSGARATTPFLHLYRHDPAPIADSLPAAAGIVTRGSAAADSAAIKSEEARREAPARLTAEREGILRSALDDLPALGARLRARYTHPAATRWPAKLWATEVKRRVDEDRVDEEEELGSDLIVKADTLTSPPAKNAQLNADAAERGTRLHEVLEALDFTSLGDVLGGPPAERERAVLATARELSRRGRLPVEWMTRENLVPVIEFLADPLAIAMRRAGASLEREAVFSLRMRPSELARIWPAAAELDEDEWVLIQGKIDAIWRDGERVIVLDFKSDRVAAPDEIRARTDFYRPQMEIYRRAAARLWSAQQVECLLYFLEPRQAVRVE